MAARWVREGRDPQAPKHLPRGGPRIPPRTRWMPPTPDVESDTTDDQNNDEES